MERTQPTDTLTNPLTEAERDEIAYMEAAAFAGTLATREAKQSEDNYGGALLHRDIPFGD